ncbi:G-protein coupled receptor 182-like [Scleropages formosus]|nr:G-protein coupled receptor 182-like [Scleropages formosus]
MESYHNSSDLANDTFSFIFHCDLEVDDNSRRVALFLLYLIPFMGGLAANTVVVWVNWRRRHSRSGVLFCLLNVTFSDLMVVLVLPFFMLEAVLDKVWLWGAFLCKFTHFVYASNFYSSSFFLAYMTVERYKLIAYPNSRTWGPAEKWRRGLLSAGLWLLAIFLALLENVHVTILEWNEAGCFVMPEKSYEEWFTSISSLSFIFQFIFPATIIISCNIYIAQALANAAQRQRDVRLVHVYSVVFVLCWLPFHLVQVFAIVDLQDPFLFSCNTTTVIFVSYSIVQCLTLFHCVANPILYNFLDQSFRQHLARTLALSLRQYAGGAQPNPVMSPEGMVEGPASAKKEQELSNTSTSHSTVNP